MFVVKCAYLHPIYSSISFILLLSVYMIISYVVLFFLYFLCASYSKVILSPSSFLSSSSILFSFYLPSISLVLTSCSTLDSLITSFPLFVLFLCMSSLFRRYSILMVQSLLHSYYPLFMIHIERLITSCAFLLSFLHHFIALTLLPIQMSPIFSPTLLSIPIF